MMVEIPAATFGFELVSPERRVMSEPARMVTIPGTEGDFGVLAGHMPLIATIRPGVVEIVAANDAAPRRVFIAGGFADVNATSCTVLAEEAVDIAALDAVALEGEAATLREDLNKADNGARGAARGAAGRRSGQDCGGDGSHDALK